MIGGGPAGYVAAIKAAQLGLKTVCIEKRGTLGGTCLNVGCIPSKALLNATHKYHELKHGHMAKLGINADNVSIDLPKMMKAKDKAVTGLTKGIEGLLKKNKVAYVKGRGEFVTATTLNATDDQGNVTEIEAEHSLICTGSEASTLPASMGLPVDEKIVVTSTGALSLSEVPKKMVVIGGGVIGMELGSVWGALGAEVTVVEFMDRICPGLDSEVGMAFHKVMQKQGLSILTSTKVTKGEVHSSGATVHIESLKDGSTQALDCDVVLMCVGRRPFTQGLGLEKLGIPINKFGQIEVDSHNGFRTAQHPNIMAVGDVIPGPMLAHKAEEEAIMAVELLAKAPRPDHMNYDAIPGVVYTHPEVAQVGKTEDELKAAGVKYKKGVFPFMANSRARANDDADGLVKVLVDENDKIMGAHIMGPSAGDLIQSFVMGMEYGACSEDIARTCHAHPTHSEASKEACLAAHFKPIHM